MPRALVFGLALALAPLATEAATLRSFSPSADKVVVFLQGEIGPGDGDRLIALIRAAREANRVVSSIRLNSPGGALREGVRVAAIVRSGQIATVVPNGAICASACFVIFAAGTERYVSGTASVGVHGASENGQETAGSSAATIAMARIVKGLGVPPAVIGKMVVTPPSEVVWLTADDLRAMGVSVTGRPAQVTQAPKSLPQTEEPVQPRQALSSMEAPRFTQDQIRDFLATCSEQADARGLDVAQGYGEDRRAFRRECMHKFGVDPKR